MVGGSRARIMMRTLLYQNEIPNVTYGHTYGHTDGLTYIVRCIHDGPPSVKTESGNYLVGVEII